MALFSFGVEERAVVTRMVLKIVGPWLAVIWQFDRDGTGWIFSGVEGLVEVVVVVVVAAGVVEKEEAS